MLSKEKKVKSEKEINNKDLKCCYSPFLITNFLILLRLDLFLEPNLLTKSSIHQPLETAAAASSLQMELSKCEEI